MKRLNLLKWLSIIFFAVPMLFILVFPFIVMVSTSFKTLQEVSQIPPTFIPREPTLENYREVWEIIPLATHFRNSFLLGLGEVLLVMALGVPAAYIPHAKPDAILAELGLDAAGITASALSLLAAVHIDNPSL